MYFDFVSIKPSTIFKHRASGFVVHFDRKNDHSATSNRIQLRLLEDTALKLVAVLVAAVKTDRPNKPQQYTIEQLRIDTKYRAYDLGILLFHIAVMEIGCNKTHHPEGEDQVHVPYFRDKRTDVDIYSVLPSLISQWQIPCGMQQKPLDLKFGEGGVVSGYPVRCMTQIMAQRLFYNEISMHIIHFPERVISWPAYAHFKQRFTYQLPTEHLAGFPERKVPQL